MQGRNTHPINDITINNSDETLISGKDLSQCILLALLFLLLCSSTLSHALSRQAGDLAPLNNPDGVVNVADAVILQRFLFGDITPTPEQLLLGDLAPLGNPDGILNAGDLVIMHRVILGELTLPPVYLGPDPPILDTTSGTTNDNPFLITGTASPGLSINLYVNDQLESTTIADPATGYFSITAILIDGLNAITAAAVDNGIEGPISSVFDIEYINNLPRDQGGTIIQDTVWTPGAGDVPYEVTSDLTIPEGITLLIQAGTTIKFNDGTGLTVNGKLVVEGTPEAEVVFTSNSLQPSRGIWKGIRIANQTFRSMIRYAMIEYGGSGVVVDNSDVLIQNCTIIDFGVQWSNAGIDLSNGASGLIENNLIDNISRYGTGIRIQDSIPEVRSNIIRNTNNAVVIQDGSPWINGNLLTDNGKGIYIYGDARALINNKNVITNNQTGLQYEAYLGTPTQVIVKNNSIYNNYYNVYTLSYQDAVDYEIDLSNNWWGTTSTSIISASIYDYKDLWGVGSPPVKFTPFLDGPDGDVVSGNFLNGRITQDVDLTAGERYQVAGSYVLPLETRMTIHQGAILEFSSSALLAARGTLLVQGDNDSPAIFTSASDVLEQTPWFGILIGDKENYVDHDTESEIHGAVIEDAFIATEVFAEEILISDSQYHNNHMAIRLERGSNSLVTNNVIDGIKDSSSGGSSGITSTWSSTISGNTISGLVSGIVVRQDASPLIQENHLSGNTYGIMINEQNPSDDVRPVINSGNTITQNDYGIYTYKLSSGKVTANSNNIFGNTVNYYKDYGSASSIDDATNNWWGTIMESEVSSGIFSNPAGLVDYIPYLSDPVPVAPSLNDGIILVNDSTYTLSGTSQAGVQIRVYVNGNPQTILDVSPDGTFTGDIQLSEGLNLIHAESFIGATNSSPSATIQVTLDTQPPIVSIASPGNGDSINEYPVFTGSLSESSLLTINGQDVAVSSDNSFRHGPVTLSEGANGVIINATDAAGNVASLNMILLLDTTPPADPETNLINIGQIVNGTISVTGAVGASESNTQLTIVNSRSGEVISLTSNPDGGFNAQISAIPGDEIYILSLDTLGNQSTWIRKQVEGQPLPLGITSTIPADGTTIQTVQIDIFGTFDGPANTGITVNGQTATVYGNQFHAGKVSLHAGANAIEIIATSPEGITSTRTVNITSTGEIPFEVTASPDSGIAPLDVTLIIDNGTGFAMQLLEVDLDNDGTFEIQLDNVNYSQLTLGPISFPAGLHTGTAHIIDSNGIEYSLPFSMMAEDPMIAHARSRNIYDNLIDNLSAGDVNAALLGFTATSRARYQVIFDSLTTNLAAESTNLGKITQSTIARDWAELRLIRNTANGKRAFHISIIKSEDGVWRIEEM